MLMLRSRKASALRGSVDLPGDKSISHRALILGSLAKGVTQVRGLLESADVLSTMAALRRLGGRIEASGAGEGRSWQIEGVGLGGFKPPAAPLDLGNAGTGVRLLMGAVAGSGIGAIFTGDSSLSRRPMARVTAPLERMGARVEARDGTYLPIALTAPPQPRAIDYASPVASAQIKSAILLAGLTARGATSVHEPKASRNHTETMLRHFGAEVEETHHEDGGYTVRLRGEAALTGGDILVPSDPSSAAFLAVAGLIVPGSFITLRGVCTNPLRFGIFETLLEMGGDIRLSNERQAGGESVADIEVRSSSLKGVVVPAGRAASMIDEYPILSIAAACAEGRTEMLGVEELRVKETDRIALMAEGLVRAGVEVATTQESMTVMGRGCGAEIKGGICVDACHDHRIAMSFLILGLMSSQDMTVKGAETIATSFPNFTDLVNGVGGAIEEVAS